jgi:hypothetical protein
MKPSDSIRLLLDYRIPILFTSSLIDLLYIVKSSPTIDIRTEIYKSNEHPKVVITQAKIADLWSILGDKQKALEQFKILLGKREGSPFILRAASMPDRKS